MNPLCEVCQLRPYVWEVQWKDGHIDLMCDRCRPDPRDRKQVHVRDGRHDWMTEEDV